MSRLLKRRHRQRVAVTLKNDLAFEGILMESDAQVLVLRQAQALGVDENGTHMPLGGEVVLFVADVLHMQVLGA